MIHDHLFHLLYEQNTFITLQSACILDPRHNNSICLQSFSSQKAEAVDALGIRIAVNLDIWDMIKEQVIEVVGQLQKGVL